MSTIVTDTLQGKTSATSITLPTTTNIGSTPLVSASANSMTIRGEGSAVTNIQQGLIKVWCYTPNDGASINDSFNVSSITDAATGRVEVFINNDMANANYSVGHTTYTNIDESWVSGDDQEAGVYRTRAYDGSNYQDIGFRSQVAGDLA